MLYLVTFKGDKDKSLIEKHGGKIVFHYKNLSRIYAVEMTQSQASELSKDDNVLAVEEDDVMENNEQEESYAIEMLKARNFWKNGYTGKGVKIAVFDGGVQEHEDLKIAGGYNVHNPELGYKEDISGHGSHCFGIINMQDNDKGYVGVAPNAQTYLVKIIDEDGRGVSSGHIGAMDWAIENDIDIVSQSQSSKNPNVARTEMYREAAEKHGIIICAAAGNTHTGEPMDKETVYYPAKHPFVVAVGAVDENKERAGFSAVGHDLTLVAPGVRIMSTIPDHNKEISTSYGSKSGTSMSTPYAAGMFALYKEKYPHLNRESLIEKVLSEAKYLGDKRIYGAGLIQPPRELKQEYARTSYVRDLEGNEYPLQATITNDYELNGNQTVSFMVLPSKVNSEFISKIAEMWHVVDHDGVEHKIVYAKRKGRGSHNENKVVNETVYSDELFYLHAGQSNRDKRTQKTFIKDETKRLTVEIKAVPLFFDTLDNQRIYERYDEHMTAQKAFNRIFKGTGFVFLMVDSFDAVDWEGFGEGETKLETFKRALERYKAEFRISGNVIYLEKQIGRDTQFMYRHKLNASNIEQEIDADNLWTYAKGYGDYGDGEGGDDWSDAKLKREYTSPLADVLGIRHAPPVKNGNIRTRKEMDRRLKALVDESLKVSVSADIHDLREQGYPIAQSELGDRVFLIDERINLNDEVRVVSQTVVRDWRGKVIDIQIAFGNEGVSKRYQSNINTTVKDLADIFDGVKQLPYSVLDERVKNATQALRDAQTQLDFTNNGIIAVDKRNPNLMTILNSAGLGVSRDGGATYDNAITGEGINATVIAAGILHGITIVQESGDCKMVMEQGLLSSYHQGNKTMTFGNYNLEFFARNQAHIGSMYPITSIGSGEKGLAIEVTKNSHFGVGVNIDGTVYPSLGIIPRSNRAYLAGPYNSATEGSMLALYANRRILASYPTGDWDVTNSVDQPSIILDQSSTTNNVDVFFGGRNKRSGTRFNVKWRKEENVYRTVIEAGPNGVTVAGTLKADNVINSSTEDIKKNIEKWDVSALDKIAHSDIMKWNMKETNQLGYGFVLGEAYNTPDEVVSEGGDGVLSYAHSSLNSKAIQEIYHILEKGGLINGRTE